MPTKTCSKCKTEKEQAEFNKCKKAPDGYQGYCKACMSVRMKAYRKTLNYPVSVSEKRCHVCKRQIQAKRFSKDRTSKDGLKSACMDCINDRGHHGGKKRTGILQIVDGHLYQRPDNIHCPICGIYVEGSQIHKDHDHKTGKFRGWLCFKCNVGLGNFGDDPARLIAAAVYLSSAS